MHKDEQSLVTLAIKQLIMEHRAKETLPMPEREQWLEDYLRERAHPVLQSGEVSIVAAAKDVLTDPELSNPHKYLPLMYVVLLERPERTSEVCKFYYELMSHAIKELYGGSAGEWKGLFERVYQLGMLLLVGSRGLLLGREWLGPRVNSQLMATRAKELKMKWLVRIYNCMLCIPEQYLTLKQVLYFTLMFTTWQSTREHYSSFFGEFTRRTQAKLLRKLRRYAPCDFIQEHVLNLVKLVLGGQELVFSHFLQIKYAYEAVVNLNKTTTENEKVAMKAFEACNVLRNYRHFFNFIIELLCKSDSGPPLKPYEREAILIVCLRFISPKYPDNEELFAILARQALKEPNQLLARIGFRFVREEAMQYMTVHKLKLLLNIFNVQNWKRIVSEGQDDEFVIHRLNLLVNMLRGLSRRYSQTSLSVYCKVGEPAIQIKNARSVKSLILVTSFDTVGRLNEGDTPPMKLLNMTVNKEPFQLSIIFSESSERESLLFNQPKDRKANIVISYAGKQLINDRKQYMRHDENPYESLVVFSLAKEPFRMRVCIDGAFYQIPLSKKGDITEINVGDMAGSIRAFYTIKNSLDPISFHKSWCEGNRKTKYVIQNLGVENLSFYLNKRHSPLIVDQSASSFSLFESKPVITVFGRPIKHVTFVDLLVQIGGLQAIFFLLQRFSRSLLQLDNKEEQVTALLTKFFAFLRTAALLDETPFFLNELQGCFKYLNSFLFLLIKRNKAVRDSHSSGLLLGIFELLGYFRGIARKLTPNQLKTIEQIERTLVIEVLTNFQIWSNCSVALQLFVLTQIEVFLKEEIHWIEFIRNNLHAALMTALVLFETSQDSLPHAPQIQNRIVDLCSLLYERNKEDLFTSIERTQIRKGSQQIEFGSVLERDLSTCLALMLALGRNRSQLSDSEGHTFKCIAHFVLEQMIGNPVYMDYLTQYWHYILSAICQIIEHMHYNSRETVWELAQIILVVVAHEPPLKYWLLRMMEKLSSNSSQSFTTCFWVMTKIISRFTLETVTRRMFITQIIRLLPVHLKTGHDRESEVDSLYQIIQQMPEKCLYELSTVNEAQYMMEQIKQQYFTKFLKETSKDNQQSGQAQEKITQKWYQINNLMLEKLYKVRLITNKNADFIRMLLVHRYEFRAEHKIAIANLEELSASLETIKQFSKSFAKKNQSAFKDWGKQSTYALIEHCRGWPTLYFLIDNGLLTAENDVDIPCRQENINRDSIGGPLAYYISCPCSPIELYTILFLLYDMLSNRLSLLSVQAHIALFDHTVQLLRAHHHQKQANFSQLSLNTSILVNVLRELMKCINTSFIVKVATISKDLERILGVPNNTWKKKRVPQIVETLAKASQRIQPALQDNSTDKETAAFMEMIFNRVRAITPEHTPEEICNIFATLSSELNRNWQTYEVQVKALKLCGLRSFQLAREHYLCLHQEDILDLKPIMKSEGPQMTLSELVVRKTEEEKFYITKLGDCFDALLIACTKRGEESEQIWRNILISNEHWFDLQEKVDDVTNKFYQLDEKQTGPYGFYKLNIRPVRSDHKQLPFPRRKQLLQTLNKQNEEKIKDGQNSDSRITLQLNSNNSLYSSLNDNFTRQKSRSISRFSTQLPPQVSVKTNSEYLCEYVTKRGVYAGALKIRGSNLEFRFMGHSMLPDNEVYQTSTNKAHKIEYLRQWEAYELNSMVMPLAGSSIFTRRYIMRHTALQMFHFVKHRSYFFNLFFKPDLDRLLSQLKETSARIVERRPQEFMRQRFTERWMKGQLSNFEYLSLINRYSGRTFNDLAQYPVMPWTIVNFTGQWGFKEMDKDFYRHPGNLRNLELPTGKLNEEKFMKLKARLRQVDASDRQIRFLYGSMYSNPTVLYNFFIRLEPYTHLHWQHQGRKLDHADRLFSSVADQFSTVLTSSADMKQITPEFYYWPEFLKNRNKIDLGQKQKGDEVDAVVLPPWARSPQQFVFKMRQALESPFISQKLHLWIDLIFGYKAPFMMAEEHDNLYHYQCYQHDLFTDYESNAQKHVAQIAVSQFGQIPESLFIREHPMRNLRKQMDIDNGVLIHKGGANSFQYNDSGVLICGAQEVVFKKAAISGLYHVYQSNKDYQLSYQVCALTSMVRLRMIYLQGGVLKVFERGKVKSELSVQARHVECLGHYVFYGAGSKINILKVEMDDHLQLHSTLYGHRDEIIQLKTDASMDVMVSVDKSGFVLVHELTDLRFLRAFQLNTDFEGNEGEKLKICLHRMGYFIFFDHTQTLHIFNYMGQCLLEKDLETRQDDQHITDIQLFSHEHSILLMSTSKGSIHAVNFLEIMRFSETYPFKTYSRLSKNNILERAVGKNIDHLHRQGIRQFAMLRGSGQTSIIYQIVVLYECGDVACYNQDKEMGEQLKYSQRLKTMGFV